MQIIFDTDINKINQNLKNKIFESLDISMSYWLRIAIVYVLTASTISIIYLASISATVAIMTHAQFNTMFVIKNSILAGLIIGITVSTCSIINLKRRTDKITKLLRHFDDANEENNFFQIYKTYASKLAQGMDSLTHSYSEYMKLMNVLKDNVKTISIIDSSVKINHQNTTGYDDISIIHPDYIAVNPALEKPIVRIDYNYEMTFVVPHKDKIIMETAA